MTFLAVGQGDCIVLNCPGGRDIVVDCGSVQGGDRAAVAEAIDQLIDDEIVETLVVTPGTPATQLSCLGAKSQIASSTHRSRVRLRRAGESLGRRMGWRYEEDTCSAMTASTP